MPSMLLALDFCNNWIRTLNAMQCNTVQEHTRTGSKQTKQKPKYLPKAQVPRSAPGEPSVWHNVVEPCLNTPMETQQGLLNSWFVHKSQEKCRTGPPRPGLGEMCPKAWMYGVNLIPPSLYYHRDQEAVWGSAFYGAWWRLLVTALRPVPGQLQKSEHEMLCNYSVWRVYTTSLWASRV